MKARGHFVTKANIQKHNKSNPNLKAEKQSDVDVDGVYERRSKRLCPPHLVTLQ